MKKYIIVTDSTTDLPDSYANESGIKIVPPPIPIPPSVPPKSPAKTYQRYSINSPLFKKTTF